jgi:hypothetical protein
MKKMEEKGRHRVVARVSGEGVHMARMIAVLILGICLVPSPSLGDPASFSVGGVELTLGMAEDSALSILRKNFEVERLEGNSYALKSKEGPPNRVVGSVLFEDGKLLGASRDWGNYTGDDARGLSNALADLLEDKAESDGTLAKLLVLRGRTSPEVAFRKILIQLPDRSIELVVYDESPSIGAPAQVGLTERIGYP